ncbi:probable RNA-directed DNA polymerase from transposon X-element [Trichonephila clavipes]|nr:probable RNA-directed DNA polymerase from transposon X-element [Trichonephila clavipes]
MDHLEPNDVIMADKGFLIANELESIGCRLQCPIFLEDTIQFDIPEMAGNCQLSNEQVTVERAIKRSDLSDVQKGMIIGFRAKGGSISETAEFVNRSRATVVKVYRAWQNGTVQNQRRGKCGAPRAIDDRGERRLRRCVRADRRATVEQLTTKMNQGATKSVSQTTIQRTLLRLGLRSRRLVRAPMQTAVHRRRRLEFARQYSSWTSTEWRHVAFSDESRFMLYWTDGRWRIRRETSERNHPATIAVTVQARGGSIMVWGMFSWHSLTKDTTHNRLSLRRRHSDPSSKRNKNRPKGIMLRTCMEELVKPLVTARHALQRRQWCRTQDSGPHNSGNKSSGRMNRRSPIPNHRTRLCVENAQKEAFAPECIVLTFKHGGGSLYVDGYNGRGVTQCFSCNNFHHNADNCYLKPRCLKCGEEHLTKDCPIKQRLETKFCINCQVYGHMANWYGCPCFPKPPKGTAKVNRNSYTNLYNSLIRPNFSYAQATSGKPAIKNKNPQQMAPRRPETSRQTETVVQTPPIINRNVNPQTSTTQATNQNQNAPIINTTNNNSDIKALLSTTVQCLIQLFNAMNTTPAIANNFDTVNSADANQMYGLIEASCNVDNDQNDRPTSNENYRAFGGTLILIKNSIKHYSLPTTSLQTIEATIVILTPIDHDPISIVSIYIPPRSDEYTFTIDIENHIQTSSNCVLFRDFNAPHTAWNCNTNSSRGVRLLDFVNMTNLYIAYPESPTRFGINSANTLDIAVIRNFYYPYTINSLHDLSSDHNPVLLNFTLKLKKDIPNPRAVHTNSPLFSKQLNTKLSLINYHPNSIKSGTDIDQKISEFTETVRAAHSHASRPIETFHKSYTPPYIHNLIKQKNQYRNLYHRALDPHYKTLYNRAQKNVKKELRKYSNENWTARLKALDTQDNSLWAVQKFLKNKRSDILPLNCSSGTAVTDTQKANILAESILDNFTENSRPNNDYDDDDELINITVNSFLSLPTSTTAETAYPSEIISYIKKSNSKKAPGKDGISNRMTKNFSLKAILILTILINKILTLNYFPKAWKEAIIFPILKPGKNKNIPSSYRPISLLSTLSKITESIILTRLKDFLYTNNIINPNQYGFTNKLSTLHPLLNLTEAISDGFQSKKSTGAVFLDIQKTFDRV